MVNIDGKFLSMVLAVFAVLSFYPMTCSSQSNEMGDYPPCGIVDLAEIIDFINLWAQGQASLADVIDLINAWADV